MKIPDVHGVVRTVDPRGNPVAGQQPPKPSDGEIRNHDGDFLDIQVSSRLTDVSKSISDPDGLENEILSSERQAQIAERIKSGFYLQTSVSEKTAENIQDFYSR